jgi:DNA-binding LacI/PurR family transcriptional regulator
MAVRLKNIARDLGVSVVTVSKVVRGNTDIGEATRRRVLKRTRGAWPASARELRRGPREDGRDDVIGFQAMQELLKLQPRPDAVLCYNDLTAVGAIDAVLHAGLRVPQASQSSDAATAGTPAISASR